MSNFCKYCGNALKNEDIFCSKCGAQVKINNFYNQNPNNTSKPIITFYLIISLINQAICVVLFFQPTMKIDVFFVSGDISIYNLLFKLEYHWVYLILLLLLVVAVICLLIPCFTGKPLNYVNVVSMKNFSELFCIFNIAVFLIAFIYTKEESYGLASCSVTPLGVIYLIANIASIIFTSKLATKLKKNHRYNI